MMICVGCLSELGGEAVFFLASGLDGGAIEGENFTPLSLGKHAP